MLERVARVDDERCSLYGSGDDARRPRAHGEQQIDRYLHEASIFIPDVLKYFDLPQVAAGVADRRLVVVSPLDAMKAPVEISSARSAYRWTQEVYAKLGSPGHFQVLRKDPNAAPAEQYLALLEVAR